MTETLQECKENERKNRTTQVKKRLTTWRKKIGTKIEIQWPEKDYEKIYKQEKKIGNSMKKLLPGERIQAQAQKKKMGRESKESIGIYVFVF